MPPPPNPSRFFHTRHLSTSYTALRRTACRAGWDPGAAPLACRNSPCPPRPPLDSARGAFRASKYRQPAPAGPQPNDNKRGRPKTAGSRGKSEVSGREDRRQGSPRPGPARRRPFELFPASTGGRAEKPKLPAQTDSAPVFPRLLKRAQHEAAKALT